MRSVCFLTDDGAYGQKLAEHFGGVGMIEKSLCYIEGNRYLFGNVVCASKLPKKGNAKNVVAYDVQWENVILGETKIDLQVVLPAIELSVRMRRREKSVGWKTVLPQKKYRPEKLFDDDVVKSLFVVHEGEDGDPMDSDTSENDDGDDERKEESEDDDDLFVTRASGETK
jgi:hypothetical protein